MPDLQCPHPDCENDESIFESERAMKIHYGAQHEGSLAKEETICSVKGCTTTFEYYPSSKEGKFCEDCTEDMNYDLTQYDVEYVQTICSNCDNELSITETEYKKYSNHFCDRSCKYSSGRTQIECESCGDIFTTQSWKADRGRRFCDHKCYSDTHRKTTNCSYCEDSVEVLLSRFNQVELVFCDRTCHQDYRRDIGNVKTSCDQCGDSMKRIKYRIDSFSENFCSDECQIEAMKNREDVVCSECETVFRKRPSEIERVETHFCSKHCQSRFYRNEDSLNSYGCGWISVRREVRKRDNYECQICGKDKSDLGQHPSAHHITPVNWFCKNGQDKEDAHYTDNLVLLCEHHHTKVEFGIMDLKENISGELAERLELDNPA